MNQASLQILTWGTVSAAVVSAMLLAAAGDEGDFWRSERGAESLRRAANPPSVRPGAVLDATPHSARQSPQGSAAGSDKP